MCDRRNGVPVAQALFFGGGRQTGVVLRGAGSLGPEEPQEALGQFPGEEEAAGDGHRGQPKSVCRHHAVSQPLSAGAPIPRSTQGKGGQTLDGHAQGTTGSPRTHRLRFPRAQPPTHMGPVRGAPSQATLLGCSFKAPVHGSPGKWGSSPSATQALSPCWQPPVP